MSEIKVPFEYNNSYGEITIEHPSLTQEQALAIFRKQVNLHEVKADIERFSEINE